jgi:hypothetical protein
LENYVEGCAEHVLSYARQYGGVFRLVPFYRELVGRTHDQAALAERDWFNWLEPGAHGRVGKDVSCFLDETLPRFCD